MDAFITMCLNTVYRVSISVLHTMLKKSDACCMVAIFLQLKWFTRSYLAGFCILSGKLSLLKLGNLTLSDNSGEDAAKASFGKQMVCYMLVGNVQVWCVIHDNGTLSPVCVSQFETTYNAAHLRVHNRSCRLIIEIKHLYPFFLWQNKINVFVRLALSWFNAYAPELVLVYFTAIKHGYIWFVS